MALDRLTPAISSANWIDQRMSTSSDSVHPLVKMYVEYILKRVLRDGPFWRDSRCMLSNRKLGDIHHRIRAGYSRLECDEEDRIASDQRPQHNELWGGWPIEQALCMQTLHNHFANFA
jgi:hypothetical protein